MTEYTRCPHCDTAFLVTEEQLSVAQGRVRCGNCKEIFVARDPEPSAGQEPSAASESKANEPNYQKYLPVEENIRTEAESTKPQSEETTDLHFEIAFKSDNESVDTDEIEEETQEVETQEEETQEEETQEEETQEEETQEEETQEEETQEEETQEEETQEEETQEEETQEEETQEEETQEEETQEEETQEDVIVPVLLVDGQQIHQHFDDDAQIRATSHAQLSSDSYSDDSEDNALTPNSEPDSDEIELFEDTDGVNVTIQSEADYQESHEASYQAPLSEAEQFASSLENLDLRESDHERDKTVDQVVATPSSSRDWIKQLLWFIGSLIILVAILATIFWFKRFELAADPKWRPYVDEICQYIDCGIPTQRDVEKIELMSREVTVQDKAVKVNMILLNRASFPQPYPRIEIDFFDLDGNRLATRVELPTEYLRKDMHNKAMTPGVPVHIEFAVDIDTEEVVGYVFRLL